MMKTINSGLLRSIFALALGIVLIIWPELTITYLVMTIGVLFIVPGIISLLSYFTQKIDQLKSSIIYPIESAGSILFGIWLFIMPGFFVNILMYIFGALLLIAGIHQLINLIIVRKWSIVPWPFYIMPLLVLAAGIIILIYPFEVVTNTFIVFGGTAIFYGVCELINWFRFKKR